MPDIFYKILSILFISFMLVSSIGLTYSQTSQTIGQTYGGDYNTLGDLIVVVKPWPVYSGTGSLILVKYNQIPTIIVNITVIVELNTGVGGGVIHREFSVEYELSGIPLPWEKGWYMVPIPSLPSATTNSVSITTEVSYSVVVNGQEIYTDNFEVIERNWDPKDFPPLVYAFVDDALNDTALAEETLGLSPWGWSVEAGEGVDVYVLAFDDNGLDSVSLEYKVNESDWSSIQLSDTNIFAPVLEAIDELRGKLSLIGVDQEYYPRLELKLLSAHIPGQNAGSVVEFRASAEDSSGNIVYSPHGFYYVDNSSGYKIMIVDPWVKIWAMSRVIEEHKPVAAIDLGHGEGDNAVQDIIANIDFLNWKLLNGPITDEDLDNIDILMIGQPQDWFSEDEKKAIAEWLAKGGKILWIGGDSDYRSSSTDGSLIQEICNDLLNGVKSHLRLERGGVYDDQHNVGGRNYRILAVVDPDPVPRRGTQMLRAGINKPVLFHGPTSIIWVSDNGEPVDPLQIREEDLVRIVYSYDSSYMHDNNPPPLMLYDEGETRKYVLMAAEFLQNDSLVIVSGETPYGGFAPLYIEEYGGMSLDGKKLVENTLRWAAYVNHVGFLDSSFSNYGIPHSRLALISEVSLQFKVMNQVRFHNWQHLAKIGDIFIVWPSDTIGAILKGAGTISFEPDVIVLSSLGLGLNYQGNDQFEYPALDWDLADITYGDDTILNIIIQYAKENNTGIIATYSTLSDMILWISCNERVKIGARGHVGYTLDDASFKNENTIAAMLGMPELSIWEDVRDRIAQETCEIAESLSGTPEGQALYLVSLVVGSTPLLVSDVPWSRTLVITNEGSTLGWQIPDTINIAYDETYPSTVVGWQLVFPRLLAASVFDDIKSDAREVSFRMSLLPTTNPSMVEAAVKASMSRNLGLLYEALLSSTFDSGSLKMSIDISQFNETIASRSLNIEVSGQRISDVMLGLKPIKILALSEDKRAAIITYDKYWVEDGYRAVYFTFDVESSASPNAGALLTEAVKWVVEWKYINKTSLIGNLLVTKNLSDKYNEIINQIEGYIVGESDIIMPENGGADIEFPTETESNYHLIIVHPTTENVIISVDGADILNTNTENRITHVILSATSTIIKIKVKPQSDKSLNPAHITLVQEQEQAVTQPPPPPPNTTTSTTVPTTTQTTQTTSTETPPTSTEHITTSTGVNTTNTDTTTNTTGSTDVQTKSWTNNLTYLIIVIIIVIIGVYLIIQKQ